MHTADVLIIGAGATGLMAAYELAKADKQVIIIEARNRTGGRIHTLGGTPFLKHAELGAEFVHGDLPVTLKILNEAGIELSPAHGEMWHYKEGKLSKEAFQGRDWGLLLRTLNKLKQDISIGEFLQNEFGGEQFGDLRESVSKFVAGYDTADPFKASAFALRKEWQSEDDDAQHRVQGGYGKMTDYLESQCRQYGAQLYLNSVVTHVYWEHGRVEAVTADGNSYQAARAIIALPLGVLQALDNAVTFSPSVPSCFAALNEIGFGAIVKLLLEFKRPFWQDEAAAGGDLKKMSFVLSDEEIPTWWTQFPQQSNLLTGWLGGPNAEKKKHLSQEELLRQALFSLSKIFNSSLQKLEDELLVWNIVNWTTDPFTRGSYVYDMLQSSKARKLLSVPVNDTLFFAGEYLYEGPAMGTVEAALTSGVQVAGLIR